MASTHRPTEEYQNSSDNKQQPSCYQSSEHPIQVESRGDPVTEASEQTAASNMETDVPPPSPVADLAASSPPNLSEPMPDPVPVRRYSVRVHKPPARLDL